MSICNIINNSLKNKSQLMIELHDLNTIFFFTNDLTIFRIKEMFNFCLNITYFVFS
jgi:hypothetical protein